MAEAKRLGGRAARKALRAAPLAEEDKAVRPRHARRAICPSDRSGDDSYQ